MQHVHSQSEKFDLFRLVVTCIFINAILINYFKHTLIVIKEYFVSTCTVILTDMKPFIKDNFLCVSNNEEIEFYQTECSPYIDYKHEFILLFL